MRKIITRDVVKLARIIKKSNVEDNITKAIEEMEGAKGKKLTEKAGVKIMLALYGSIGDPEVEELIYDLFGGIAEISPQEFAEMPFEDAIDIFKRINAENNLKAFFSAAGRLI